LKATDICPEKGSSAVTAATSAAAAPYLRMARERCRSVASDHFNEFTQSRQFLYALALSGIVRKNTGLKRIDAA